MAPDTSGSIGNGDAARERRRRINEAFRSGELDSCLREITTGLRDDPHDSALLTALGLVQTRYMTEVVEPAVATLQWNQVDRALATLREAGHLGDEIVTRLARIDRAREEARRPPPEELLDVREKALRKAEEAWASGRRREARELLRSLEGLPLDDQDLVLRRDGLRRLMHEDMGRPRHEGVQPHTAGRWAGILGAIVVLVIVGYMVRGIILPHATETPLPLAASESAVVTQPSPGGWLEMSGTPEGAEISDSTGAVLGFAFQITALPGGTHLLRIGAPGHQDTTLIVQVAGRETTRVEVVLQETPPSVAVVSVRSDPPGALVLLEGTTGVGVTPLEVSLQPGTHRLLLTAEGKVPEWLTVRAESGHTLEVTATLWTHHRFGQLQINATPWAFVFVNGDSLGPTPLTTGNLETGVDHQCEFRRPDGSVIRQQVRLDPKRSGATPLTVGAARPAVLAVATRDSLSGQPTWANVWLGSRRLGESPGEFDVPAGEITVRIEKEGYVPITRTVRIGQGQRATVTCALLQSR